MGTHIPVPDEQLEEVALSSAGELILQGRFPRDRSLPGTGAGAVGPAPGKGKCPAQGVTW